MAPHSTMSAEEAADRLAIRELFDAYAHCADTRDAEGQKALFTADTRFVVYMDGSGSGPSYVLEGREALSPVFADLNRYEVTMHFNGQSTVRMEQGRATGDSYTIAHHVYTDNGTRMMMVAWLRYLDSFTKVDQSWYIAERQIILEWSETRPLGVPTAG
jgi:SnoaL-like domain